MTLVNCELCYEVFIRKPSDFSICDQCIEKDLEEFRTMKNYIRRNPHASIQDIHHNTKIALNTILRWKREGRIY